MNALSAVGLALILTAPALKDSKPPPIVGVWEITSFHFNGKDRSATLNATWEFTADGRWLITTNGKDTPGDRRYKSDLSADPATVDLDAGPGTDPRLGIFRVDGDSMTLCIVSGRPQRPAGFDAPPGSANWLYALERVKPKD
jgi:uncharacterized protein (TIGR03067 family)